MWEDVHEEVDKLLISQGMQSILSNLPEKHHLVLYAWWFEGFSFKEISEFMKISPDRVRQIKKSAFQRLKKECFVKEFSKLGFEWIEKSYRHLLEQKEFERKTQEQEFIEYRKKLEDRERELRSQREIYKPLKPIEVPLPQKPEIEPPCKRTSIFPPTQVVLRRTIEGHPFLWVNPALGTICREKDAESYDRWLDWLIKNENRKFQ